jgi:hypothetical protein
VEVRILSGALESPAMTAVVAGRRAIWRLLGQVAVYDGGADGVASTMNDKTLFAVGGVFFP